MPDALWLQQEARTSLRRLLPRIRPVLKKDGHHAAFLDRLDAHFPRLFGLLYDLYGARYDFFYHLEAILRTAARMYVERPADLRQLDSERLANPRWFQSEQNIGGVIYVDLFAGDLEGVRKKIPYFREMGLNYLHLMPLFEAPAENSDGGYAVSDYRKVNKVLGSMAQLTALAGELRRNGISLVIDFVFNHTSDEHTWAKRALAGDEDYQNFYYMFPDRTLPNEYEKHLREIFPDQAPGNFIYVEKLNKWVWTTFNTFQWDLNYTNPATFNAMLGEMLFLANHGVEVLRLDAVAFIWKQLGTPCENLPQVHLIIRAYNALMQIVAPAVAFKSEAIVHPDDVASYIDPQECPISYNPTFMALIWEALATREVRLLRHSMSKRWDIPDGCAWINYVRVHDDIGWSFADEDAAQMGINGFDHRQFLNRFYTGRHEGSFAAGLPFNYNPQTQDMRICGTAASLAGLERALAQDDAGMIENAIRRILLIHNLIIAAGGIPLLYLGDEIATLNDYSFQTDPTKARDERWVHRPRFNWNRAELRSDPATIEGRIFQTLCHMIAVRQQTPDLAGRQTLFFDTHNPHVLGFIRNRRVMVLANFSEQAQTIRRDILAAYWTMPEIPLDFLTGESQPFETAFQLDPYQVVWWAEPARK